jgi:hypothetical protein
VTLSLFFNKVPVNTKTCFLCPGLISREIALFGTYFVLFLLLVLFWKYFERSGFEGRSLPWEVGGAVLLGAACTAQRSHTGAVCFIAR